MDSSMKMLLVFDFDFLLFDILNIIILPSALPYCSPFDLQASGILCLLTNSGPSQLEPFSSSP